MRKNSQNCDKTLPELWIFTIVFSCQPSNTVLRMLVTSFRFAVTAHNVLIIQFINCLLSLQYIK